MVKVMNCISKSCLAFVMLGVLGSCQWFSDPGDGPVPPDTQPGWVAEGKLLELPLMGKDVLLGCESPYAKPHEEMPRMRVLFSYALRMDSTEVTQAEWTALLPGSPLSMPSKFTGPDLPVTHLTWYDALLFCNARSKKEKRDTVYRYVRVVRDSSGRVRDLPGLVIEWKVAGYRLPTEAEWEFAARAGSQEDFPWGLWSEDSARKYAWYGDNSEGRPHPVATRSPNAYGLYDLTGNVLEWVSDWKGAFAQGGVKNFLGQNQPNQQTERVIKGGGYPFSLVTLRPSARSATYATQGASLAPYVGFRCVLGPITDGEYLYGTSVQTQEDAVQWLAPDFTAFLKTNKARFAVVQASSQRRTLHIIDLSARSPQFLRLGKDTTVFAPVFSPDGKWIAYGNAYEGMDRKGTISIIAVEGSEPAFKLDFGSAYLPRWHVDEGGDTLLIYATTGVDNTDGRWSKGETYAVSMRQGKPTGAPVLLSQGAFHDGLTPDGERLVTGYRHLKSKRLGSPGVETFFTSATNGKPWEDTSQVCNVSLNPGGTEPHAVLFLDFGAFQPSIIVGRTYGIHEIAFLADSQGEITGHFGPPKGFVSFDDLEWSNHSRFAASVFLGSDGEKQTAGIVEVPSGRILPIARSGQLEQPALWVKPDAWADTANRPPYLDSLFQYEDPPTGMALSNLAVKVRVNALQGERSEIVILGSSRMMSGVQTSRIHSGKAVNLASSGQGLRTISTLLENYVIPFNPKLKAVAFDCVLGWLEANSPDDHLRRDFHQSKGFAVDRAHDFWRASPPPELDSVARQYRNELTWMFDSLGNMPQTATDWGKNPPLILGGQELTAADTALPGQWALLRRMVKLLEERRIALVITLMPESPHYAQTESFGKYGPKREVAAVLVDSIRAICEASPICAVYDANLGGGHDYVDSEAINEDHLATTGALRFTPRLDSVFSEVLSR
jgi:uncharacterized protein (TIGR02171 family)